MRSASPDDERELPSLPARRVAGPVVASVMLHGGLLYLLAHTVTVPDAEGRDERPSIRVSIAMRAPRPVAPPESVPVPEANVPEIPVIETETPAESAATETAQSETTDQVAVEEEVPLGGETIAPATTFRAWTPARIRAAIETHSSGQRGTATSAWLADCFREQKEHGTRDCERQLEEQDYASASARAGRSVAAGAFAGVVRPANDWRLSQQFLRNNAALEELAEGGGVVGKLATDRILINNEYMRYLEGNVLGYQGQDPLWHAMNSGFKADVLGGRSLSLPGNVPFRCGRGKLKAGPAPGGLGVTDIVDCVFEFNGFEIERPEQAVEENAFRVVPVIPGSQQYAIPASPVETAIESPAANPVTP